MENKFRIYNTKKVFKDHRLTRIVDEGLTEKEAQAKVKEDIKINPEAKEYMLIYCKMKNK